MRSCAPNAPPPCPPQVYHYPAFNAARDEAKVLHEVSDQVRTSPSRGE